MKKSILTIAVLMLCISKGYSWGHTGHEMVGSIAKAYTSKAAQDSVNKYLGGLTWEKEATWMDDIRSDHSYDFMKPMHYMNVEKDKTYVKTTEVNVINELEIVIVELKDRSKLSKDDIIKDLRIVFHLVGDLHMPLHVGYGVDKGGNGVDVDFMGKSTNLHHVWDSDMIEYHKTTSQDLTELCKKLTKADIKAQQKVDVVAWMNESRSYLPQVYDFKKGEITEEYINKNIPIVEKQILNAGLRLSGILDEIFSTK